MPVAGHVRQEIASTATSLLALCGLASMIPGSTGPEMAAVAAPVFLGAGARDITGPPHDIPRAFCGSNDITLFVLRDGVTITTSHPTGTSCGTDWRHG